MTPEQTKRLAELREMAALGRGTSSELGYALALYDAIADGSAVRQARANERDAVQRAGDAEVRADAAELVARRAVEQRDDAVTGAERAALRAAIAEAGAATLRAELAVADSCHAGAVHAVVEQQAQLALAMAWGAELADRYADLVAPNINDCPRCKASGIDPIRVGGTDPDWCRECGGGGVVEVARVTPEPTPPARMTGPDRGEVDVGAIAARLETEGRCSECDEKYRDISGNEDPDLHADWCPYAWTPRRVNERIRALEANAQALSSLAARVARLEKGRVGT